MKVDNKRIVVGLFFSLVLAACGGSDSNNTESPPLPPQPPQQENKAPTVNAGGDQSILEGSVVSLSGSGEDSDGSLVLYSWVQVKGTTVVIDNASSLSASFVAPNVDTDEELEFMLTVTDNDGATTSDSMIIVVTDKQPNIATVKDFANLLMLLDNETLSLDVISNDTVSDNSSLELISVSEAKFGEVSIVDNQLFYAPVANSIGTDLITYQVSDGSETAQGVASITVVQYVTIAGYAIDDPISDAQIKIYSTANPDKYNIHYADGNGYYITGLPLYSPDEIIMVEAQGVESNNQEHVLLTSIIGTAQQLVDNSQLTDAGRKFVTEDNMPSARISHISTATEALITTLNDNKPVINAAELATFESLYDPNKMLEMAVVVQMFADDGFILPDGVINTRDFLSQQNDDKYMAFVNANSARIDEKKDSVQQDRNPLKVKLPKRYTFWGENIDGLFPNAAEFHFNDDGTGIKVTVRGAFDFIYTKTLRSINITYDTPIPDIKFTLTGNNYFAENREEYGLTEEDIIPVESYITNEEIYVYGDRATVDCVLLSRTRLITSKTYPKLSRIIRPEDPAKVLYFFEDSGLSSKELDFELLALSNVLPMVDIHEDSYSFQLDLVKFNQDNTVSTEVLSINKSYSVKNDSIIIEYRDENRTTQKISHINGEGSALFKTEVFINGVLDRVVITEPNVSRLTSYFADHFSPSMGLAIAGYPLKYQYMFNEDDKVRRVFQSGWRLINDNTIQLQYIKLDNLGGVEFVVEDYTLVKVDDINYQLTPNGHGGMPRTWRLVSDSLLDFPSSSNLVKQLKILETFESDFGLGYKNRVITLWFGLDMAVE